MEQNSKYFTKTAEALRNLRQTAEELALNTNEEINNNIRLQAKIASLRQEIHEKANRIDSIIDKLKGAID
jgi:hypothetical protein